ncbi:MAG: hypothetical protein ACT4OS_04225 [Acidimicrobiales bacterium]
MDGGAPGGVGRPVKAAGWDGWLLVSASLALVGLYIYVALSRVDHPFELQWIEGAVVDQIRRVSEGLPLYAAPTIDHVGLPYPPLFPWLGAGVAAVVGQGFLAPRLISLVASVFCLGLIAWLVRAGTGSRVAAMAASGLYAGGFSAAGYWYDVARVDSLMMALLLGGLAVSASVAAGADDSRISSGGGRESGVNSSRGSPWWMGMGAGGLLALAFLTKQSALIVGAPVALVLAARGRRAGVVCAGTLVVVVAASTLTLNVVSGGWYQYFLFGSLASHRLESPAWTRFWTRDLAPLLLAGVLLVVAVAWNEKAGLAAAAGRIRGWARQNRPVLVVKGRWMSVRRRVDGGHQEGPGESQRAGGARNAPQSVAGGERGPIGSAGGDNADSAGGNVATGPGGTEIRWRSARSWPTATTGVWMVAGAGLVATAWVSRLHSGGYSNVLMPAVAAGALGFGWALAKLRQGPPRLRLGAGLIAVAQLAVLLYDPTPQIPDAADRAAGNRLVAELADIDGPVLVVSHPWYAVMAGKPAFAHGAALGDLLRGDNPAESDRVRTFLAEAVRNQRFSAVVFDLNTEDRRGFPVDFDTWYEPLDDPVFGPGDRALLPVTDLAARPSSWWVRRAVPGPSGSEVGRPPARRPPGGVGESRR